MVFFINKLPAGSLEGGIEPEVAHALCNPLAQHALALGVEVELGGEVRKALEDTAGVHTSAVLLGPWKRSLITRINPAKGASGHHRQKVFSGCFSV